MESTQAQFDRSPANHIKVNGLRSILILNPSILKMRQPSKLSYYCGSVVSGSDLKKYDGCPAVILKLEKLKTEVEKWYFRLTKVDHPCVIKALGFAHGAETDDINFSYLALEPFDTTFASYTRKKGLGVDVNGRFTEEMIALISNIINGMEELHSLGFFCPKLEGDKIAVMKMGATINAKILMFELCAAGKEDIQKNGDWSWLGHMLKEVAWTNETMDLVDKIKKGQLKGQSILKHSALLTVREKVQNALALNFHISVYYPKEPGQSQSEENLKTSEICVANLKTDLDRKLVWTTPACVTPQVTQQTLRGFVKQIRIVFEHENKFVPPKLTMEEILKLQKPKDLDHQLQDTSGELYRAVQMLAAELNLKY